MPVHDWSRVDAGLFHDFHQSWIVALRDALNLGLLPPDYFALAEETLRGPIPDVLTLRLSGVVEEASETQGRSSAIAVTALPPRAAVVRRSDREIYARKADGIAVRHRHGQIVAVIEIVSPGNKASRNELRAFVEKASGLIGQGVHLLVVDPFPPNLRAPCGIHKAIWDDFEDEEFDVRPEKPLILASYDAGPPRVAYVESVGIGDVLPDMPLFLLPEYYVPAPLETTYQTAWRGFPAPLKPLLT
jgi:hypothetical protein